MESFELNTIKITVNNVNEYAELINEIIYEIAIDTEEYIPTIIEDISKYYVIPKKYVIFALKKIDSPFTANNNIVFFYKGKEIKRTAFTCAQRKLIVKIGNQLKDAYSGVEDATEKFIETIRFQLATSLSHDQLPN